MFIKKRSCVGCKRIWQVLFENYGVGRITNVKVKFGDISRNTGSEGGFL
jgi:hypothetical protein